MLNQRRKTRRVRGQAPGAPPEPAAAADLESMKWGELRKLATANGVRSVGVKRAEIERELAKVL